MTTQPRRVSEDIAYMLPMGLFLILTWTGTQWPMTYPIGYIVKTIATGIFLLALANHYSKISWKFWWLGIVLGIVGTVQWIGMGKILMDHFPIYTSAHSTDHSPFNIENPTYRLAYIIFRLVGPVLVVPFMEELFWRDFLWRTVVDPDDFQRAKVGQWNWRALAIVTIAFASVHGWAWPLAIIWGLMIAALLVKTKSLGACILMHATTNLLLGIWVMVHHDWAFW
jgi:CAAX prenyl protease-like protein